MQYVARPVQSVAISSLEALTVAYVVCALFPYAAWSKKPYDLESLLIVAIPSEHTLNFLFQNAPLAIPMNDDPALPLFTMYCGQNFCFALQLFWLSVPCIFKLGMTNSIR